MVLFNSPNACAAPATSTLGSAVQGCLGPGAACLGAGGAKGIVAERHLVCGPRHGRAVRRHRPVMQWRLRKGLGNGAGVLQVDVDEHVHLRRGHHAVVHESVDARRGILVRFLAQHGEGLAEARVEGQGGEVVREGHLRPVRGVDAVIVACGGPRATAAIASRPPNGQRVRREACSVGSAVPREIGWLP